MAFYIKYPHHCDVVDNQCAGVNFTVGAAGSPLCVNGTGITAAPVTNGFPISSDDVEFNGFQNITTAESASASAGSSASATSSPSASATAKSAGSVLQVGFASIIGGVCLVLAFL
jgi:hypothetical protein